MENNPKSCFVIFHGFSTFNSEGTFLGVVDDESIDIIKPIIIDFIDEKMMLCKYSREEMEEFTEDEFYDLINKSDIWIEESPNYIKT